MLVLIKKTARFCRDLPAGLGLFVMSSLVCPIFLYHHVLSGWWRFDDPHLIRLIMTSSTYEFFVEPQVWQSLSLANFTPWLVFSLYVDQQLSPDLRPVFFYMHQLLMVMGVSVLSYIFLRQWRSDYWAALGTIIFVSGVPVLVIVNQLMTRHYLEGLFFFILSLLFFQRAVRQNKILFSILGALVYLLAMSAKEIYVMLAVAAFFWPEGSLRQRLKLVFPYMAALLSFVLWRGYMLGWQMGGYGSLIEYQGLTGITKIPVLSAGALVGEGLLSSAVLVLTGLIIFIYASRSLKTGVFALASIPALFLPLVPVVNLMSGPSRFFILIWWSLSMAACMAFSARVNKVRVLSWVKTGLALLLLGTVIFNAMHYRPVLENSVKRFEVVGRFIWDLDGKNDFVFAPELFGEAGYLSGVVWLKKHKGHGEGPEAVFADMVELYDFKERQGVEAGTVWRYSRSVGEVKDITNQLPELIYPWLEGFRKEDLRISLRLIKDMLHWEFGPYQKGEYHFIVRHDHDVSASMRLPSSGYVRTVKQTSEDSLFFRIRYNSLEGWWTYSPWLEYVPTDDPLLLWER